MRKFFSSIILTIALTACGDKKTGNEGPNGGTLVISTAGDADVLLPPLITSITARQVTDLVFERLAELKSDMITTGDAGYEPRLAEHWVWAPDSMSIVFHLNSNARWHDGKPIRSNDVKFTHALYTDSITGSPIAPLLSSIDSVTSPDSLTAVFWYNKRSPLQFFDAVYQMMILPEHVYGRLPRATMRSDSTVRKPIGSGKYKLASWNPGSAITLTADTAHYRGRAKLSKVIWMISPDFNTAQTRFLAGEADLFEALRPDVIAEVAKNPDLRMISYPGMDYAFMQLNVRRPVFADREIRRALTMALDRQSMVRNVFDSMAVVPVGPTVRAYATTDTTIASLPYDTARAYSVLDSLGWKDTNNDGIRDKGGRPLTFTLLVPSSSKNRVRMAVLIQEQLRKAGVKVNVEEMEFGAFLDRQGKRDFDAMLGAWHVDASPGGLRHTWGTEGSRSNNGTNYGSYESPVFDAYVDSALATTDPARSKQYFTKAYTVINGDAPAVWLYEPRAALAMHKRIRTTSIRPDAWWQAIDQWWIPEAERTARDNVGK